MSKTEVAIATNNQTCKASPAENMVSMIEQVAMNPDVPVDKMERMMAMQERIMEMQAKQEYTAAMVRVQGRIPPIVKHGNNTQTGSKYATLDDINAIVTPVYSSEGFAISFGTDGEQLPGTVRIVAEVSHIGGYSKTYSYDSPIDDKGIKGTVNKTPTHARGSANSYGQRYLVKMIFNLTLIGEDDDGNAATTKELDADGNAATTKELDADAVIDLFESAKTLAKLDARTGPASKLKGEDRKKATEVYRKRKEELKNERGVEK